MKVLVMIKGSGGDEGKIAPMQERDAAMGVFNERLVKAGIILDGGGLRPSSDGVQVVFEAGATSVVDGPFTEAKEIVAGYWIWQVRSLEEAVEWAKRCPADPGSGMRGILEIRPYDEAEDFGAEYPPGLQERDARIDAELRSRHAAG